MHLGMYYLPSAEYTGNQRDKSYRQQRVGGLDVEVKKLDEERLFVLTRRLQFVQHLAERLKRARQS